MNADRSSGGSGGILHIKGMGPQTRYESYRSGGVTFLVGFTGDKNGFIIAQGGNNPDDAAGSGYGKIFIAKDTGNVGIGTMSPAYKSDVEGAVQVQAYYTGDIVFQKDGKKLWRMFEDECGLYLENLKNGKVSRIFLEEDIPALKEEIKKEIMEELK